MKELTAAQQELELADRAAALLAALGRRKAAAAAFQQEGRLEEAAQLERGSLLLIRLQAAAVQDRLELLLEDTVQGRAEAAGRQEEAARQKLEQAEAAAALLPTYWADWQAASARYTEAAQAAVLEAAQAAQQEGAAQ